MTRAFGVRSSSFVGYHEGLVAEAIWRSFIELESAEDRADELQFGVDANWSLENVRMSSILAVITAQGVTPGSDVSFTATKDFSGRTSFSLTARRYAAPGESSASTGMSASLQHRLTPRWSILAAYNDSRAAALVPLPGPTAGPPPIDPLIERRPRIRFGWISLRYDMQAGSPSVPLGGEAGSGGGRIEGTLFLDLNGNGQPDAGETRLSNVDLVLDGRYSVRSDAQGRFEFPFVASRAAHAQRDTRQRAPALGLRGLVNPGGERGASGNHGHALRGLEELKGGACSYPLCRGDRSGMPWAPCPASRTVDWAFAPLKCNEVKIQSTVPHEVSSPGRVNTNQERQT